MKRLYNTSNVFRRPPIKQRYCRSFSIPTASIELSWKINLLLNIFDRKEHISIYLRRSKENLIVTNKQRKLIAMLRAKCLYQLKTDYNFWYFFQLFVSNHVCTAGCACRRVYAHVGMVILVLLAKKIWTNVLPVCIPVTHHLIAWICLDGTTANVNQAMRRVTVAVSISTSAITIRTVVIRRPSALTQTVALSVTVLPKIFRVVWVRIQFFRNNIFGNHICNYWPTTVLLRV